MFLLLVKILEKRHIIREKKVPYVSREKEVLSRLSHPFFVQLYFTFQDKERLCILHNSKWTVLFLGVVDGQLSKKVSNVEHEYMNIAPHVFVICLLFQFLTSHRLWFKFSKERWIIAIYKQGNKKGSCSISKACLQFHTNNRFILAWLIWFELYSLLLSRDHISTWTFTWPWNYTQVIVGRYLHQNVSLCLRCMTGVWLAYLFLWIN